MQIYKSQAGSVLGDGAFAFTNYPPPTHTLLKLLRTCESCRMDVCGNEIGSAVDELLITSAQHL